jgi:PadR family transcriptional regulator PadR
MSGMVGEGGGLTELRRGVLGPCVLALLAERPRFGLELVRDLSAADGLLTSDGTVYPLLNRLRDAGLVTSEWHDAEGERARRYYSITEAGLQSLAEFRDDWAGFTKTVGAVLHHEPGPTGDRTKERPR